MANYAISNGSSYGTAQLTMGTSYSAVVMVTAATSTMVSPPVATGLRRGKIYDLLVGTNQTPADAFVEYSVKRVTAGTTLTWLGSLSSVSSAFALDQADVGYSAFSVINTSAGSTANYTQAGELFYVGVNQRASYRWVAAPGSELVYAAVSSASINGLALLARGSLTTTVTGTVLFSE